MRAFLLVAVLFSSTPLWAKMPSVVTDIAPIQSLVALVMGDLGQPALLLDAATDPHDFQMRPSQARALSGADLVIWMGPALLPWLDDALATLAPLAQSLPLLAMPQARVLGAQDGKDRGDVDPHAWLDPVLAADYLTAIAAALSALDPDNAATYGANASRARRGLQDLDADIRRQLDALNDIPLIAYHDAYRYFLTRYDLHQAGHVTDSAGAAPGAAGLSALRAALNGAPKVCILIEPGHRPTLINGLDLDAKVRVVELDALGISLVTGPALYDAMIRNLATALAGCATP